ncbi:MAG: thiolase family protein [Gammaproteobacteria bacterium]|nr:thiolase family protein [Gammaproteobacteria bacterium]NIR82532.1 thiolase family protein [Gammaproteobacteria bacterium]NIR88358.1 thiolase family protein [Gammaproteobacteria bacterium]NIU03670.1 thiolase family protein [Gammaproteobacteria bacterium]NIV52884.1 acetyl-CoA C-acyltransferase [Gammaproteobacteria bacterium]
MRAYLLDGCRSPIGAYGGSLLPLRATEFGATVAQALLDRTGVAPERVERLIAGMVLQHMTESNPARIVQKRIGVPDERPAWTINMQCCSSMQALITAAQQVALGEVDLVLVLGLESMSRAPHTVEGARWGLRLASGEFNDALQECTLAGSKMWGDPWYMIDVAEHHARVDNIGRAQMDEYALLSHQRAVAAIDAGYVDDEIVPIEVPRRSGVDKVFATDEHPRRDCSLETLALLPTVKPDGAITAGNAAGINDGSAAALVCSERVLGEMDIEPLAEIPLAGTAMAGCDPRLMGYSAVHALDAALTRAGRDVDDLDLIECNEGFAVQLIACRRMGGWPEERVNVDGGSIGLGHPVGMSGLRIVVHLAHALRRRDGECGAATVPAGSGLGTAVILDRYRS